MKYKERKNYLCPNACCAWLALSISFTLGWSPQRFRYQLQDRMNMPLNSTAQQMQTTDWRTLESSEWSRPVHIIHLTLLNNIFNFINSWNQLKWVFASVSFFLCENVVSCAYWCLEFFIRTEHFNSSVIHKYLHTFLPSMVRIMNLAFVCVFFFLFWSQPMTYFTRAIQLLEPK